MIPGYDIVKWIHILSAAVFFTTGFWTAVHMWLTNRGGNVRSLASSARNAVRIDLALTAPSSLALPISGAILVGMAGFPPGSPWLIASYILYTIAIACWTPATWLRMQMRDMATVAAGKSEALPGRYYRYMRWWFQLSWPAFIALLVVFYLMVSHPQAAAVGGAGIPAL